MLALSGALCTWKMEDQVVNQIGRAWIKMSDEHRKHYIKIANQKKREYSKQLQQYFQKIGASGTNRSGSPLVASPVMQQHH